MNFGDFMCHGVHLVFTSQSFNLYKQNQILHTIKLKNPERFVYKNESLQIISNVFLCQTALLQKKCETLQTQNAPDCSCFVVDEMLFVFFSLFFFFGGGGFKKAFFFFFLNKLEEATF